MWTVEKYKCQHIIINNQIQNVCKPKAFIADCSITLYLQIIIMLASASTFIKLL